MGFVVLQDEETTVSWNPCWDKVFEHEPERGFPGANQDITFLFPIRCLFLSLPPES